MSKINNITLALLNYRLYKSPYQKNLIEVYNTIKKLNLKGQLIFLKNLITLKIEELSPQEFTGACYDQNNNIIFVNETKDNLNHELFHVLFNKKNNQCQLPLPEKNENLIEALIEYLALKSENKRKGYSDIHQVGLFIIEFLESIYHHQLFQTNLNPDKPLYSKTFQNLEINIFNIEYELGIINLAITREIRRQKYLVLVDLYPTLFKNIPNIEKTLKLDGITTSRINDIYEKYNIDPNKLLKNINITNYILTNTNQNLSDI